MIYRYIPVFLEHRITCQNARCFHADNGVLIAYVMGVAEWILFVCQTVALPSPRSLDRNHCARMVYNLLRTSVHFQSHYKSLDPTNRNTGAQLK
jgi:hypothetical protein